MSKVTVVGGGVNGLTTAIRLAERRHDVEVVARDYLVGTTSWVATAIWHLFWVQIDDRVEQWAATALREFINLAKVSTSGVTLVRGIECVREDTAEAEDFKTGRTGAVWKKVVPSYRQLTREELVARLPNDYPSATLLGGYVIEVPIADMSVYLQYLMTRLDALDVQRHVEEIDTFTELRDTRAADWYINCTGLGARQLVGDEQLQGVKGQILRVSRDGGISEYIADDHSPDGMTYVLPRGRDIVLGGSADPGIEDSEVDLELAARILERCTHLVPGVADCEVLEHLAGVRPYRPHVRLELDTEHNDVIHNYGHGGSGVSLSWGCAAEVCDLISLSQV